MLLTCTCVILTVECFYMLVFHFLHTQVHTNTHTQHAGGEVYAWGTNSMGQCGQGHSNGSITTPSKVHGLDGIQIQQISAGTSHSIVWTAVPIDRFVLWK